MGKRIDYYGKARFNWRLWLLKIWAKYVAPALIVGLLAWGISSYLDTNIVYAQRVAPGTVIIKADDTLPPILQRIADCESGNGGKHGTAHQFNADGSVLHGRTTPADTGYFQINMNVWASDAKELGLNVNTLEGNKALAVWIFDNYGSVPWYSSGRCWK